MKVFLGVDGSPDSFAAVKLAARLLSASRDGVFLFYAPPEIHLTGSGETPAALLEKARSALGDALFHEVRSQLPAELAAGSRGMVGHGPAGPSLLRAATEAGAEMLVVGARGLSRFERLLLGSVSRAVVHGASVPVLVARLAAVEASRHRPLRVLLACDGSRSAREVGEWLHRLTWPEGSIGHVIRVTESMFAGKVPDWLIEQARLNSEELLARAWVEEHDRERDSARESLLQYCGELPAIFQGQEPIITEGHPARQILAAIDRLEIDLVVVGGHRLGPLQRFLAGSTSEHLMLHAPCSVLIVRHADAA
jgi:nucleotide-binding universal stress UspA family protein